MVNNHKEIFPEINQNLNNFGILDSFSIHKRQSLITSAESIITFISKENVSYEQIEYLKDLQIKLIKKSKGNFLSNFFLKIINKSPEIKELDKRVYSILTTSKKIDKFLTKSDIKNLPFFLSNLKSTNTIDKLVFEDHLYERIKFFNHNFTFNSEGEITFKYSEIVCIDDEIPENSLKEVEGDEEEYWEEIYQEFVDKGLTLKVKESLESSDYNIFLVSQITAADIKKIIVKEDGNFNKNIEVIYPPEYLTLEELEEYSVLEKDEESNEYFISSEYQYLEKGFIKHASENWQYLQPFTTILNPPKNFTVDIIVHSKPGLPDVFGDQGHASIKMTTPKGEVYSVGFFPDEVKQDTLDLSMQRGKLMAPDNYLFLPLNNYEQHTMTYTLPDSQSFHKLINWLEALQGYHENKETGEISSGNLFYHPLYQNCASFASSFRDYALQLGAKSQKFSQHKISNWTKENIKLKEIFLDLFLTSIIGKKRTKWNKGIDYAEINNYNITNIGIKRIYLPIDLISDHINFINPEKDKT